MFQGTPNQKRYYQTHEFKESQVAIPGHITSKPNNQLVYSNAPTLA